MIDHGLDLAVIGNGRTAALVDPCSRIVWWCYPRFDGDPIFCRLLSGKRGEGILRRRARRHGGLSVRIYPQHRDRLPRCSPTVTAARSGSPISRRAFANSAACSGRRSSIRIVEPIAGLPRITIRMRPTCNYGKPLPHRSLGSNHIRYSDDATVIRLTTDAPLSLIDGEAPFVLTRPLHLVFGPDEPFTGDLEKTCRDFLERTHDYWMEWVRRLSISYDWQEAIIRAAITLKLSNFDETGGIVAAHTTSIPEAPSSGRTWDYRYCWLRDAYFVVQALNRIGATRTMEEFISFTLSIAAKPDQRAAAALQRGADRRFEERIAPRPRRLSRRRPGAHRQRRRSPGAARHLWQRHPRRHADVLRPPAAAPGRRRPVSSARIARRPRRSKGVRARRRHLGISRSPAHPHPFGGDVLGRLPAARRDRGAARARARAKYWNAIAEPMHAELLDAPGTQKRGAFTAAFGSDDLDASVLLLADLGVVEVDDPRFVSTVAAMERELVREKHVMRYASADDFGMPVTAFLICRFWLIDALWSLGRREAARDLFTDALAASQPLRLAVRGRRSADRRAVGQFSADLFDGRLILSAMRLSRSWEDRYWRG